MQKYESMSHFLCLGERMKGKNKGEKKGKIEKRKRRRGVEREATEKGNSLKHFTELRSLKHI